MSSKTKSNTNYFIVKIIIVLMFIFLLYIIISKCNMNNHKSETYETYENEPELAQDSGSCKTEADVVDYCINYNSCCSANSLGKTCLCNHPFVTNCRTNFTNCLNNNPNNLSNNDLMTNCINENKTCCNGYNNNLSIKSSAFTLYPKKNDPVIKANCNLTNVSNIDQKCLELCTTTPNCASYSLQTGALVSDYGTCSLYDTVSISVPLVDKKSGNPIPFISDYYTKN